MTELFRLSACSVVEKLRSGELSIKDLLDAVQARIAAVDGAINSLPTLCFERAAKQAAALQTLPADRRGILAGLPVTIKDLTDVAGVCSTSGSLVLKDRVPEVSDQLVTRIEGRGGVVYAKSNTPEFGAGGVTFNSVFGNTRSPYDLNRNAGGSSGGAAASLACGCAWLSHGSDMAGSLRTPASFCGVTSLRPSPFTIRTDSPTKPFDVLGADGPMARTVADLALFADAMRNDDSLSMQAALRERSIKPFRQLNIAFSHDLGVAAVSAEVRDVFQQFIDRTLNQCESTVEAQPALEGTHEAFDTLRAQFYATGLESLLDQHRFTIKPEVVWNVEQGLAPTSRKLREAERAQGKVVHDAAQFMKDIDVLICPATSLKSVAADCRYPGASDGVPVADYYRWLAIAYASTMTTLPIITLPVGHFEDGFPFGIQLIGKPGGEAALFQIAQQIEQLVGGFGEPVDPR